VLTAFLLQEDYEAALLDDIRTRWALIRDIMTLVDRYARAETHMLIRIHEADPTVSLFALSEKTSEQIFALQRICEQHLETILADEKMMWAVLEHYIPAILIHRLGKASILNTLGTEELKPYRDAIITKKLASMAFYSFGAEWTALMDRVSTDFSDGLRVISKAIMAWK
jgi:glutamate dehydrogenase